MKKLVRAHAVHAERKHCAPIEWVIFEGKLLIYMPPESKNQQHRNPPCSSCPKEHGEAFDEGQHLVEEWRRRGALYECRSSQSRDGHRAHVDPVRRHQVRWNKLKERVAIKNQ